MAEEILPSQVQAARALVGWSQEALAKESGVSISTIRDFESGRRLTSPDNLRAMQEALQRKGGVLFVLEDDDGGPGVRLAREKAKVTKHPTKVLFDNDTLPFTVRWRGADVFVYLSREALEDLAETREHLSDRECVAVFTKWQDRILAATTRAIYAGLVDSHGRLTLRSRDVVPSRRKP
jgi:transcriptional regulator with XRE-family HTH domain